MRREEELLRERLAPLSDELPPLDVAGRVEQRFPERFAAHRLVRARRRRIRALLAVAAAAGIALVVARTPGEERDGESGAPQAAFIAAFEPLRFLGGASPRLPSEGDSTPLLPGQPLPTEVLLLFDTGPARIGTDSGTTLAIEPPSRLSIQAVVPASPERAVVVHSGRLRIVAGSPSAAVVLRLVAASQRLRVRQGEVGLLATESGRWAASVVQGSLDLAGEAGGPERAVHSGRVVGGFPGAPVREAAIPEKLELQAEVHRIERRYVVEGIADVLAEVLEDRRPVPRDGSGAFRLALDRPRLRLVALDSLGRRVEREFSRPNGEARGGAAAGRRAPARGVGESTSPPPPEEAPPGGKRSSSEPAPAIPLRYEAPTW